ncbi:MAG: oligosaccharide flippase family protein [Pseudomonadota bacterium]
MLKNIFANWSQILLSALTVFILYPIMIDRLGEAQYGTWLLIMSIAGYFLMLQLGVPMANVRFLSAYLARDDWTGLNRVLSTNLVFFSLIGLLTVVAGVALAALLGWLFDIPAEYLPHARAAMVLVAVEVGIRFATETVSGLFHARQQFVAMAAIKNTFTILRAAAMIVLVVYDRGLIWLALIVLVTTIAQSVVMFIYAFRRTPQARVQRRLVSRETFNETFGFGVYVLLLQFAARLSFNTDAMVLGAVVSVAAVVYFSIAASLLIYLTDAVVGIAQTIMPRVSSQHATGDLDGIGHSYLTLSRYVSWLLVPVCVLLVLYSEPFFLLWIGEDFASTSSGILAIMVLGYYLFLVQRGVGFPILLGTSTVTFLTWSFLLAGIVNVLLSIWWGQRYGFAGVAWGTTVPLLIVSAMINVFTCRRFDVSLPRYLLQVYLLPGLVALTLPATAHYLGRWLTPDSYLSLAVSVSACLLAFAVPAFFLLLTGAERRQVLALLPGSFRQPPAE